MTKNSCYLVNTYFCRYYFRQYVFFFLGWKISCQSLVKKDKLAANTLKKNALICTIYCLEVTIIIFDALYLCILIYLICISSLTYLISLFLWKMKYGT